MDYKEWTDEKIGDMVAETVRNQILCKNEQVVVRVKVKRDSSGSIKDLKVTVERSSANN
jgi:hypothetical protein